MSKNVLQGEIYSSINTIFKVLDAQHALDMYKQAFLFIDLFRNHMFR